MLTVLARPLCANAVPRRSLFVAFAAFLTSLLGRCNFAPAAVLPGPAAELPDVEPESDPPLPVAPTRPKPYQIWVVTTVDGYDHEPEMLDAREEEHEARQWIKEANDRYEDERFELRIDREQQILAERLLAQSDSTHRFLPPNLRPYCDSARHDRLPAWLTPEMIRTRAARAAHLSRILGNELTIEYSPASTGDDSDSKGHMFVIPLYAVFENYVIDDREPDLPGQMAQVLRNCATWLTDLAAKAEAVKGGAV